MENDTVKLLRECNAGIKMGVSTLDDVIDHVKDQKLKKMLITSKETHGRLGNETRKMLEDNHDEGKEPAAMAKMMSVLKTNLKFSGEDSDRVAADLVIDGCNMGVKSLYKYLHQYKGADEKAQKLTQNIIAEEEKLVSGLKEYL